MRKKIIGFSICVIMAFSNCISVSASNEEESKKINSSFSATYNSDFTNQISSDNSNIASVESKTNNDMTALINQTSPITVELKKEQGDMYSVSGIISLHDGQHNYTAKGHIKTVEISTDGKVGIIGNVLGSTDDTNQHLNLTIHAIPSEDKVFIFTTVGVLSEEETFDTIIYGNTFTEMEKLINEIQKDKEVVTSKDANELTTEEVKIDDMATMSLASDYNVQLRGTGYGGGIKLNGSYVQMSAVTFYTPLRVKANSVYKTYVKINSNEGNANIYARDHFIIIGTLSTWANSGYCEMGSADKYMELKDLDPQSDGFSVSLPIPYVSGGAFNFLPWSFNIYFSTIDATRTKLSGSLLYNVAKWSHNYSKNVDWSSSGPAATTKGFSGQSSINYQYNRSYDYTLNMYGKGNISYSFSGMYGAQSYSGSFTVATPIISNSIVVDKTVY